MKVADLLATLGGDGFISAADDIYVLGRSKLVVARGPVVIAEIDVSRGTISKRLGIAIEDADACNSSTPPA